MSAHAASDAKVVVEYKYREPLDLLDLTSSLAALGEQYRRYSATHFAPNANVRLHVGGMRTGSIIAELIPVIEAANWVADHRDLVAPFVANYGDILNLLKGFPPKAREIPPADVRGAKQFVAPIAKNEGSQVNIYAETGATVITNVYNIGTNGAKKIRKHANIVLGGMPDDATFDNAPMVLFQMRDGPAGSAGDYGYIDQFTSHPVKIRWASEDVKAAILDRPDNVFDLIYFVTGSAQTAGGKIASYTIRRLDDVAFKPEIDRHG
ncbi:MAG: hypothetical protein V4618_00975 [Pseudomonadota bacterium]